MQTAAISKALQSYGGEAVHSETLGASPHRLIQMLMSGALDKIAYAKGAIGRKDLAGKSKHISWAISIINGLRSSLDMDKGGEIADNLNGLYGYMNRCLTEANIQNDVAKLDEVSSLMREIKEGWDAIPEQYQNPAAA